MAKISKNAYIARDRSNNLFAYTDKPLKCIDEWEGHLLAQLSADEFPKVKWSDKEPTKVILNIEVTLPL